MPDLRRRIRFTRVAGPTPDAPDVYSPLQAGWVSPATYPEHGASDLGRARSRRRRRLRQGAIYGEQIRAELARQESGRAGARSQIRDAIDRPDVPRAGRRPRLVRRQPQEPRARGRRAVARTRPRSRSRICSARRARRSSRRVSTRSSPMWAAASAAATTRRSRSTSRSAAMFFPGHPVRLAHDRYPAVPGRHQAARVQDALADRRRSRDRQDPRLRRRSRARWRRPRQFLDQRRRSSARPPRSASTTFRRSTSRRSRCIRAA